MEQLRQLYELLSIRDSQIRVFTLNTELNEDGQLQCTMQVISLEGEPSTPYTALSYVWGDSSVTENIIVNDLLFPVTTNLASALRHIRKCYGAMVLWVDAICINQIDVLERNCQVTVMGDIYSQANKVIAWLGPDEDDGEYALTMFGQMCILAETYPTDFEWVRHVPGLCGSSILENDDASQTTTENALSRALELLFERPYWRRVWTIQERVLAQEFYYMCGSTTITGDVAQYTSMITIFKLQAQRPEFLAYNDWLDFLNIKLILINDMALSRFLRLSEKMGNRSFSHLSHGPQALLVRVSGAQKCKATDPRDKIFALLSLGDFDIKPDYSKPTAEVYTEFARRLIESGEFQVLLSAGVGLWNSTEKPMLDLPSWVPNWNEISESESPRYWDNSEAHAFADDGGFRPKIIRQEALHWPGVVWDLVSRREAIGVANIFSWDLIKEENLERIQLYPSGILRTQALFLLMLAGGDLFDTETTKALEVETESFYLSASIFFLRIMYEFSRVHCPEANILERIRKFKVYFHLPEGEQYEEQLIRGMFGPRNDSQQSRWDSIARMMLTFDNLQYDAYHTHVASALHMRRIFHTRKGYIGLGPMGIGNGDIICILKGVRCPVILRQINSYYIFVGVCYVVGIMDGEVLEAVKHGEASLTELEIR